MPVPPAILHIRHAHLQVADLTVTIDFTLNLVVQLPIRHIILKPLKLLQAILRISIPELVLNLLDLGLEGVAVVSVVVSEEVAVVPVRTAVVTIHFVFEVPELGGWVDINDLF